MILIDITPPSIVFEPCELLECLIDYKYAGNNKEAYQYFLKYPYDSIQKYVEHASNYFDPWDCSLNYDIEEIKEELKKYINDTTINS